ncbi:MAG: class I SAM-dependent methyltransferase [Acidiferrobacteraceae bacterium]
MRNIEVSAKLAGILYFCFDRKASYVDIAGGYGMLVRLMRDHGFDFYWQDPYCENMLARGFEEREATGTIAALTAFEVLEHVHDPVNFVSETLARHQADTLIFSTQVYAGDRPPAVDWWYYSFATGQHISFYQLRTLRAIAGRLSLKFYSANGIHVFTSRTLSPLVFGLACGRASRLIAPYVRRILGPKTTTDHERIKRNSGSSGVG